MSIVLQSHVMKSSYEMFHLMGFNEIVMEGVQPKLSSHIDMRLSNLIQMCWDKSLKTTYIFGNLYPIIRYCKVNFSLSLPNEPIQW
jgi:hypothetical protein